MPSRRRLPGRREGEDAASVFPRYMIGMFDWFKKKPPPEPPSVDRVWRSEAVRLEQLALIGDAGPVVIVAFFEATRRALAERLGAAAHPGGQVTLLLADRLGGHSLPEVPIYVAERHPLPTENRELLERLAREAPGRVPVFFSALDEPLMRRFGGERLVGLLDKLGLEPNEAIEHPMVGQAMANAREKVSKSIGFPQSAPSAEEWFLRNVR